MPEPLSLWNRGGLVATRGVKGELERVIGTSIDVGILGEVMPQTGRLTRTDEEAKRSAYNIYLKKYLRCVKGVDDNIGRLFSYLEKKGLLDNTLIMYTGDQGFFLGEHDLQDKRWAYEPSVRMPLIVSYPGQIPADARSDALLRILIFL